MHNLHRLVDEQEWGSGADRVNVSMITASRIRNLPITMD